MNINHDNIETYIIDYIDGELDDETSAAVIAFINLHPTYQSMLDDYQQTIMCEEPLPAHITFDKSSLYKTEAAENTITFKPKYQWKSAVAAALLLGIMIPFLWPKSEFTDVNQHTTAHHTPNITTDEPAHTTPPSNVAVATQLNTTKPIEKTTEHIADKAFQPTNKAIPATLLDEIEYIASLPIASNDIDLKIQALNAPEAILPEAINAAQENKLATYFDLNLPIDDIKQEGIALVEKIHKAKEIINNTTFIAKIGNREFKIK